MFDNQNPLMAQATPQALPPQGVPAPIRGIPHGGSSVPALAGQQAGQPPLDPQTLGGMTVQQALAAMHGGGGGMGGFRNALMGLMHPQGGGAAGWLQSMGQMWHPQGGQLGGPVMTPGGGGGGGPPQGVGMVPGVPGSMGLNPGAPIQGQPNYQLPTY